MLFSPFLDIFTLSSCDYHHACGTCLRDNALFVYCNTCPLLYTNSLRSMCSTPPDIIRIHAHFALQRESYQIVHSTRTISTQRSTSDSQHYLYMREITNTIPRTSTPKTATTAQLPRKRFAISPANAREVNSDFSKPLSTPWLSQPKAITNAI